MHHLVSCSESAMIYQFLMTQWKYPAKKNEWTQQVWLENELSWNKKRSKSSIKDLVKKQMRKVALLEKKESHSKMMSVNYSSLMLH